MFDINGWEVIVLALVAVVVLGPERLPVYAAKLARAVRQLRVLAEGARVQLKDQLGPDFDDVNWRQYDPRQYDPRASRRAGADLRLQSFRRVQSGRDAVRAAPRCGRQRG